MQSECVRLRYIQCLKRIFSDSLFTHKSSFCHKTIAVLIHSLSFNFATSTLLVDKDNRYEDAQRYSQSFKKKSKRSHYHSSDEENSSSTDRRKRSKKHRKELEPSPRYIQVLKESAQRHRENLRLEESSDMGGKRTRGETKAEKEIAALKAKLAEEEKKNKQLEDQMQKEALLSSKKKRKTPTMVNIPANHKDSVLEAFKEHCWPQTKFIANRGELKANCARIMAVLPQFQDLVAKDNADEDINIDAFVDIYGNAICGYLNSQRTGVAGNMRKAYVKRASNGSKMPTAKELLSVIYRKDLVFKEIPEGASKDLQAAIKAENEGIRTNLEIFRWYWECLLPCVSGKQYWGLNIRKHVTISKGVFPDDRSKKYVTSSDEALVLIMYENCDTRFPWVAQCYSKGKTFKNHKAEIKDGKLYVSKWTDSKAGQCKWGGWSEQGRIRYGQHRQNIARARKLDSTHVAEKWVLARIRGVPEEGVEVEEEEKRPALPSDFGKEAQVSFLDVDSDDDCDEIEIMDLEALPKEVKETDEEAQNPRGKKKKGAKKKEAPPPPPPPADDDDPTDAENNGDDDGEDDGDDGEDDGEDE